MSRLFDSVHNGVSALEAAQAYGLIFGRSGRARCPWHDDRHPDLAFYDGGKHCYCHACHAGGDSIDLTAQIFGCSALEAARKLNVDFRLGADEMGKTSPEMIERRAERNRAKAEREMQRRYASRCAAIERESRRWLEQNDSGGWDSPGFITALKAYAKANEVLEQGG